MKTCPSCGAACNDTEKFCGNCGHSFQEAGSVSSQPYAPAENAYSQPAAPVYPGFDQPVTAAPKVATKKEFMKLPENKKIRSELNAASIITFVCAGITLLSGVLSGNYGILIDVAIMVGLGLGVMLAHSRACAIILLAYGLLNVVVGLMTNGVPSGYLIVIAGILAVIYAFKAEKLWKQYQQNP